jgi:enoyl-CoA hydratase
MVEDIAAALREWEGVVAAVLIDSSHPKVFCAGGDIRAIRQFSLEKRPDDSFAFFSHEYRLNNQIASYAAPIVSLIDGVCMGGGMGLSIHGAMRVITEKTLMAMPETAIGFFPDVGASFFLSRLPGEIGMYLGLTGARVSPGDAMYTGLGTHFVAELSGDELQQALVNRGRLSVADCVQGLAEAPPQSELSEHRGRIDACFSGETVHDIVMRLRADSSGWARSAGEMIQAVSPQSLEITQALLRWASDKSLEQCLQMELALGRRVIESHDFVEGVRAVLVDKDRNPNWRDAAFGGIEKDGSVHWREHTLVSGGNGGTL